MRMQDNIAPEQWTVRKVLEWTISYFESYGIDTPRVDAEILLAHSLAEDRVYLYINYDMPLSQDELAAFRSLVLRRAQREPVAYIVGTRGFWSMDLKVTPDVLIPRPETETVVETALSLLLEDARSPRRILEIGAGSGAIILALVSERPGHLFFASDKSVKAVELARDNARHYQLAVHFFAGDWFSPLIRGIPGFDLILSNPPYIRTGDIPELEPEIRRYEPLTAIDGGADGLTAYQEIIRAAPVYLTDGGSLILEIGHDQKDDIRKIIADCGCYDDVLFIKDYGGHVRVIRLRKKACG